MPVWVSAQQLQQLRIDLDVELGPGQRPQSAVPQAIGASLPGVNYVGEPAYLIVAAQTNVMTMDAGYWSENSVNACADQGVEAYVATGSHMARNLRSKKGSRIYAQRKAIVELVNGQFKEYRVCGASFCGAWRR